MCLPEFDKMQHSTCSFKDIFIADDMKSTNLLSVHCKISILVANELDWRIANIYKGLINGIYGVWMTDQFLLCSTEG